MVSASPSLTFPPKSYFLVVHKQVEKHKKEEGAVEDLFRDRRTARNPVENEFSAEDLVTKEARGAGDTPG